MADGNADEGPTAQGRKRKRVLRVAGTYSLMLWFGAQVCEVTFPLLRLSELVLEGIVLLGVAGLPVAIVAAWLVPITPRSMELDRRDTGSADGVAFSDIAVNVALILASLMLAALLVLMIRS